MFDEDKVKISFYAKNPTICPVCREAFRKEELLSGGGRMNAGSLTEELHRLYIPTQKYGAVFPLIYPVSVCPACLYAAYSSDFEKIDDVTAEKLFKMKKDRISEIKNIFPHYNYYDNRRIQEGILSYILATMCYDVMDSKHQPIFKQALSTLRAAWLCNEYHKMEPNENFNYLRDVFYRKARFFYSEVIVAEKEGREFYEEVSHFGPDLDHNHGFDGVLFLAGLLEYKYGPKGDKKARIAALKIAKITVSRIVGMGKSSKSKPSAFVDGARDLHGHIKDEIKSLEGEV